MSNNQINASFYEKSDFSKLLKNSTKKKYIAAKTKRITINISEIAYNEAQMIDRFMNMGYQNVLKAAIMLGLNDLYKQVNSKSNIKN
ncbi:MAG TPA: hypothetical protein DC049_12445 [Spirochaetia bacterium]|nr:hypothetical protein [Spirochaetia bacterium]